MSGLASWLAHHAVQRNPSSPQPRRSALGPALHPTLPLPTSSPFSTSHPQAVNWLRRQWSEGNNAVLADEQGLGKSASVLTFLQSLRADFSCPGPVLLVAPAASLTFWEGERWASCWAVL